MERKKYTSPLVSTNIQNRYQTNDDNNKQKFVKRPNTSIKVANQKLNKRIDKILGVIADPKYDDMMKDIRERASKYSIFTESIFLIFLTTYLLTIKHKGENNLIDFKTNEMDIPFSYIQKQLKMVISVDVEKAINMVDTSIKHLTNPQGAQEPIIELVKDHDPEKRIARRIKFLFKNV